MLKTSSTKSIKPRNSIVRVNNNRKEYNNRVEPFSKNKGDGGEIDSNEVENNKVGKNYQKMSKSKKLSKSKKIIGSLDFFTSRIIQAFIKLRQACIKAPIFYHYNPEYYIQI